MAPAGKGPRAGDPRRPAHGGAASLLTAGSRPRGGPPADLAAFPSFDLTPDVPLFQIHLADREAGWFCSCAEHRFDLPPPLGTRHLAAAPIGAFLEVFRDTPTLARSDVDERRLSELRVPAPVRLADFTHRRSRGFGVTATIHSTEDYEEPQRWARALQAAGFGGVRWWLRHDPAQRSWGAALFRPTGAGRWRARKPAPIPEALLEEARTTFGYVIVPIPP